jgi:hypothetical protein
LKHSQAGFPISTRAIHRDACAVPVLRCGSFVAGSRLRAVVVLGLCLFLAACASQPDSAGFSGEHRCEAFFIYSICIADRDDSGDVDYVYFGDDLQVFMYDAEQEDELRSAHLFHRCAVPMSAETRDLSSQLLYGDDLGLSERLALKGKLIRSYRAAQPAVDACYTGDEKSPAADESFEDPFLSDDDWDDEWDERGERG